jgi:hypothetical protein
VIQPPWRPDFYVVPLFPMKRQSMVPKKKRGPPPTGKGEQVQVRIQPGQMATLDAWIAGQDAPPSRPEAIRRLIDLGLAGSRPLKQRSHKAAAKAIDMASQQIDKLIDPSAPAEERQQRKRRLLKGPREFRDIRGDLPKRKG